MERGEPITVIQNRDREPRRMVFVGVEVWGGRSHITYTAVDDGGRPPVVGKLLTEEGVTWARGHSGPAVDALLAAEALR